MPLTQNAPLLCGCSGFGATLVTRSPSTVTSAPHSVPHSQQVEGTMRPMDRECATLAPIEHGVTSVADAVKTEMRGDIALLVLNRPKALNAISRELARGVVEALRRLDADAAVKGVVMTGAGDRAFCAGVDLQEARHVQVHEIEDWFGLVCSCYRQILLTDKPVIAALNGLATGGGFQMSL